MSESQLEDLTNAVLESNKKLEFIAKQASEEVRLEKEGNLVEQKGNSINVSF